MILLLIKDAFQLGTASPLSLPLPLPLPLPLLLSLSLGLLPQNRLATISIFVDFSELRFKWQLASVIFNYSQLRQVAGAGWGLMWQPESSAHVKAVIHQWIVNVAVIIVASGPRFAVKPFRCIGGVFCLVPPFVAALLVAAAVNN